MKLLVLISGLLLIVCSACENKDDLNKELLIGNWKLKQTSYPVYSPTVSFYDNGEYKMMEFIKYPFSTTIINAGTITGEYTIDGNNIEFTTATIELNDDATGSYPGSVGGNSFATYFNNWNNDSILQYANTRKPINISGYNPIIWTVFELTENTLKAVKSHIDTLVYIKN